MSGSGSRDNSDQRQSCNNGPANNDANPPDYCSTYWTSRWIAAQRHIAPGSRSASPGPPSRSSSRSAESRSSDNGRFSAPPRSDASAPGTSISTASHFFYVSRPRTILSPSAGPSRAGSVQASSAAHATPPQQAAQTAAGNSHNNGSSPATDTGPHSAQANQPGGAFTGIPPLQPGGRARSSASSQAPSAAGSHKRARTN